MQLPIEEEKSLLDESHSTAVEESKYPYHVEADEEEQEEINFDQLLGDAAQSQADYEEDRDDLLEDDDDDKDEKGLGDSLSYTKTAKPELTGRPSQPMDVVTSDMWGIMVETHGLKEVETVYDIVSSSKVNRLSEAGQKQIAEEVERVLSYVSDEKRQKLIEVVSSFMIF